MSIFSVKHYKENLGLALIVLGGPLFAVTLLAVVAEIWLRFRAAPASAIGPTSVQETVSLALAVTRLVLPIAGGLVTIPVLLSRFFHKLYGTRDLGEAHDVLNRLIFGPLGLHPYLQISEGKVASGSDALLGQVGGPCWMLVHNDSAVVTEQCGRLKRVVGVGLHKLERFERIWEVIDLRPQRWVFEVSALTKEGIPVSCEVDLSFKIDDRVCDAEGREHIKKPTDEEPYPYTEEAVFLAAISKVIRDPEQEEARRTWAGRVALGLTDGILRNILAEYRLDWLLAPPQPDQPHPREEIRRRLEMEVRKAASSVGARVLGVQLGAIEVKAKDEEITQRLREIVSRQWIEAWYADWERRALLSKVEGEAELLRIDMARVQAQADMVVTLTEALQSTIAGQGAAEPYILAFRLVEALRRMSYNVYTREFMPPEAIRTLRRLLALFKTETGEPAEPQETGQLKESNEE